MMYSDRQQKRRNAVRGFTTVEMIVTAALALLLMLLFLPSLRRNREAAQSSRNATITANLRRIESAKSLYVSDKQKKEGETVTLQDLLQSGYLKSDPHEATGIFFDPGAVGVNVSYRIDPSHRH